MPIIYSLRDQTPPLCDCWLVDLIFQAFGLTHSRHSPFRSKGTDTKKYWSSLWDGGKLVIGEILGS